MCKLYLNKGVTIKCLVLILRPVFTETLSPYPTLCFPMALVKALHLHSILYFQSAVTCINSLKMSPWYLGSLVKISPSVLMNNLTTQEE